VKKQKQNKKQKTKTKNTKQYAILDSLGALGLKTKNLCVVQIKIKIFEWEN